MIQSHEWSLDRERRTSTKCSSASDFLWTRVPQETRLAQAAKKGGDAPRRTREKEAREKEACENEAREKEAREEDVVGDVEFIR